MEREGAELQEAANLFDVTIPDYRDIKLCRREITVLKELWDIVVYVQVSNTICNLYLNVIFHVKMKNKTNCRSHHPTAVPQ